MVGIASYIWCLAGRGHINKKAMWCVYKMIVSVNTSEWISLTHPLATQLVCIALQLIEGAK